jgi:hypothetical protein
MQVMRNFNARLLAPILRMTGYRFSKHFRWGTNFGHRITYRLVSTVMANIYADGKGNS